jgi:hypothetical protein
VSADTAGWSLPGLAAKRAVPDRGSHSDTDKPGTAPWLGRQDHTGLFAARGSDGLSAGQSVSRSVGQSVSRSVGQSVSILAVQAAAEQQAGPAARTPRFAILFVATRHEKSRTTGQFDLIFHTHGHRNACQTARRTDMPPTLGRRPIHSVCSPCPAMPCGPARHPKRHAVAQC